MSMRLSTRAATVLMVSMFVAAPHVAGAQQPERRQDDRATQDRMDQQQRSPRGMSSRSSGGDTATSNRMLEDRVLLRLAEQAWVGGDFKVSADRGTLTLSGTVPSEGAKRRMGRLAENTLGVYDVQNELRVTAAAGQARSVVPDATLNERVARSIAKAIDGAKAGEDWWFTGWRVEGPANRWSMTVEADNGNVIIDGDVPRLDIMRKAVDAARQVQGVMSVESDFELDRRYGRYPYGYGYPYGVHGYGYPYGAYGYGDPYYAPNAAHPNVHIFSDDTTAASPATGDGGGSRTPQRRGEPGGDTPQSQSPQQQPSSQQQGQPSQQQR